MKLKKGLLGLLLVLMWCGTSVSQPDAVLTCTEGYGSPYCRGHCYSYVQLLISQLVTDIQGVQIVLRFDTSSLKVLAVNKTNLVRSFDFFEWNQRENGIIILGVLGTIEKNSEGSIANIFFESSELDWDDYSLTFDVEETILACSCANPIDLELVDGRIHVGYWDQWYYFIYPGILDFGPVELCQSKALAVNIERVEFGPFVINNITSDHSDFVVYPTSFIVDQGETKQFVVTFSPSEIGSMYAYVKVESPNTLFHFDHVIALGVGSPSSTDVNFDQLDQDEGYVNFELYQNWPNPFNPETDIRYKIADGRPSLPTTLKIFNILGQTVRTLVDEVQGPGAYSVTWDGRNNSGDSVPNGLYLYRLRTGDFIQTKKCLLVK